MEKLVDYLPLIGFCLSALVSLINMVYTRYTGKSIDKEVQAFMKYRTPDYREKQNSPSQEFSNLVTEYELDKRTDTLNEKPEKLDIQQLINSAVDTALDAALSRLMPDNVQQDDGLIQEYEGLRDDLDVLLDAEDAAEEYRSKYKLPDTMSFSDILAHMDAQAKAAKAKIEAAKSALQPKEKENPEHVETQTDK